MRNYLIMKEYRTYACYLRDEDQLKRSSSGGFFYGIAEEFIKSGGIVFGGGEPLLNAEYIKEVCDLVPPKWKIRIETSLNVKWDKIELLLPYIDQWIIDIKDSNTEIYKNFAFLHQELTIMKLLIQMI